MKKIIIKFGFIPINNLIIPCQMSICANVTLSHTYTLRCKTILFVIPQLSSKIVRLLEWQKKRDYRICSNSIDNPICNWQLVIRTKINEKKM